MQHRRERMRHRLADHSGDRSRRARPMRLRSSPACTGLRRSVVRWSRRRGCHGATSPAARRTCHRRRGRGRRRGRRRRRGDRDRGSRPARTRIAAHRRRATWDRRLRPHPGASLASFRLASRSGTRSQLRIGIPRRRRFHAAVGGKRPHGPGLRRRSRPGPDLLGPNRSQRSARLPTASLEEPLRRPGAAGPAGRARPGRAGGALLAAQLGRRATGRVAVGAPRRLAGPPARVARSADPHRQPPVCSSAAPDPAPWCESAPRFPVSNHAWSSTAAASASIGRRRPPSDPTTSFAWSARGRAVRRPWNREPRRRTRSLHLARPRPRPRSPSDAVARPRRSRGARPAAGRARPGWRRAQPPRRPRGPPPRPGRPTTRAAGRSRPRPPRPHVRRRRSPPGPPPGRPTAR